MDVVNFCDILHFESLVRLNIVLFEQYDVFDSDSCLDVFLQDLNTVNLHINSHLVWVGNRVKAQGSLEAELRSLLEIYSESTEKLEIIFMLEPENDSVV